MSLQHARSRAEQLANEYLVTEPAVKVKEIAEQLGLRVLYEELPNEISGMLITRGTVGCIVVQQADSKKRQRFTIAHEIGHHCLKHQFEPGAHLHIDRGFTINFRSRQPDVDHREVEANQFAASLLMPARLVRNAITNMRVKALHDFHVEGLADLFEVSVTAMSIRLSSLGML